MRHDWTVEEIDPTDKDGLIAWASDLCHGLDINSAAEAINVEPTADAVIEALTGSLPLGIKKEVADVCREALQRKSGPSVGS